MVVIFHFKSIDTRGEGGGLFFEKRKINNMQRTWQRAARKRLQSLEHRASKLFEIKKKPLFQLMIHYKNIPRNVLQGGAGMGQWLEHSPSTIVVQVRFPGPASNVSWVCWFSALNREVFCGNSGFPSPQKPKFDLFVLIVNFRTPALERLDT